MSVPPSRPLGHAPRDPRPPEGETRYIKRSAAISLVLVAGAAALILAEIDPAQEEEEALVYGSSGDCIAQGLRTAETCLREYEVARTAYAATAPRYESAPDCEAHHGPGGCVAGATVAAAAAGAHLPLLAGYMIGRSDAQALPTQPLYAHAPQEERGHSGGGGSAGGGYCTGWGGRVAPRGGSSHVVVPASVARTVSTSPRTVSRGGFGSTGRTLSFSGFGRSGG